MLEILLKWLTFRKFIDSLSYYHHYGVEERKVYWPRNSFIKMKKMRIICERNNKCCDQGFTGVDDGQGMPCRSAIYIRVGVSNKGKLSCNSFDVLSLLTRRMLKFLNGILEYRQFTAALTRCGPQIVGTLMMEAIFCGPPKFVFVSHYSSILLVSQTSFSFSDIHSKLMAYWGDDDERTSSNLSVQSLALNPLMGRLIK